MKKIEIVRKHLEDHGSISKVQASLLGIGNVNDAVMRLRRKGMRITTVTKKNLVGDEYTAWVNVG